jgi:hypothetical protein
MLHVRLAFGTIPSLTTYTESTKGEVMPQTEFTLEDIRQVVREESEAAFDRKFDEKFQPAFNAAFKPAFNAAFQPAFDAAFNAAFKPAFDAAFDSSALAIQQDFNRIHQRFDRLEDDIKGIGRIVGQHSKEIIGLKSRIT